MLLNYQTSQRWEILELEAQIMKRFEISKFRDVTEYQAQSLIPVIYTCLGWQSQRIY